MAINLWKIGVGQTSYNPLPSGYVGRIKLNPSDYIISFIAFSSTSAQLRVSDGVGTTFSPILTPIKTKYTFNFTPKQLTDLWLNDQATKGDIIIEDIQLVQKPLPKLTINGIDGFRSSKWALHANTKVIDDETLELNADNTIQRSGIAISVKANEKYTFSNDSALSNEFYWIVRDTNASGTVIVSGGNQKTFVFTAPASGIVWLSTTNTTLGKFTFKRPMLNLGTTPAPYEPKRGEKMVLPTVKKNLFDGVVEPSTLDGGGMPAVGFDATWKRSKNFCSINPNRNYAVSYTKGMSPSVYFYTSNFSFISSTTANPFVSPSNASYFKWKINSIDSDVLFQLEEGTTATPYTPYAVQLNKKPKRYVPKKNLFDKSKVKDNTYINTSGAELSDITYMASDFIPIVGGKSYYQNQGYASSSSRRAYYNFNKSLISQESPVSGIITPPVTAFYVRFTIRKSDMDVNTLQLEEGTTATPYEPYQLVLPKAKQKRNSKRNLESKR